MADSATPAATTDVRISQLPIASPIAPSMTLAGVGLSGSTKATRQFPIEAVAAIGYQHILAVSASRELAASDRASWLRSTGAAAITLTLPGAGSGVFGIGETLNGVQAGAGKLTIAAPSGVTINKPAGTTLSLRAQGSTFCLIKVATGEWDLFGDLEVTP